MDKRKVIAAYRRGLLTVHECAQLLGLDSTRLLNLVDDASKIAKRSRAVRT